MRLVESEKFNKLVADDGYLIKDINDEYVPEHTDEEGNKIDEYFPHLTKEVFLPKRINFEEASKIYTEVKKNNE